MALVTQMMLALMLAFFAGTADTTAIFPSGAEFLIEVAASDAERARGYMFREEVGAREGMLFLFDRVDRHSFWMKNCKVALDIIWLDEQFRVTHIAHDQQPCPEDGPCPSVVPMRAGRFVLEVAGGTCRAESLQVGDRIEVLAPEGLRR